jgi:ABC-2 type transport system ATP-binding protein
VEAKTIKSLELRSVTKNYDSIVALQGINLDIEEGTIEGLLGPNGSGKSTLMKAIMGLVKPDAGDIRVFGKSVLEYPVETKKLIGYVPEDPRLYEFLTAVEYLDFIADAYAIDVDTKDKRINEFLDAFGLKGRTNELISGYSGGMKQKLAIISSLLHKPRILIFDEALTGLDPISARIVKDLLHKLAKTGVTILFSTHVLAIAEVMCDQITLMHSGQIIARGQLDELQKQAKLSESNLEDIFLKLTGTNNLKAIVDALK